MQLRIFGDPVLFHIGPVPVTETMVTSTAVTLVLIAMAVLLRHLVWSRPQHWLSVVAFLVVESFDNLVEEIVGRRHAIVATLAGSLFLFIACCNIAGQLPGVHPATGSLATTSALAVVVFLSVPIAGIRTNGVWGYIKHYFRPNPLLMPLHVISELSRTLALAVRLFGNIMSGHLVVGVAGRFGRISGADTDHGARFADRSLASVHLCYPFHRLHRRGNQRRGGITNHE